MKSVLIALGTVMMLAGAVALSGCDGPETDAADEVAKQPEPAFERAPDFFLESLAGEQVTLRVEGAVAEPTLLVFWATWCPACRNEIPAVDRFYREHGGKGVRVLSVSVDQGGRNVPEFVKKTGLTYPVLLDKDGSVAGRYGVRGIPSVIVVDSEGRIRHKGHSVEEAEKVIEKLVAEDTRSKAKDAS